MAEPKPNLDSLFISALEIESAAERVAFLDRACAGDAALRAEVDRLLASNNQAGSFLAKPAPELGATLLVSGSGEDRSVAMEAGFAAAFEEEQAVVISTAGLSVLKSLGMTGEVPRVALRDDGDDPIVKPKSAEMPDKSDSKYQLQGEIARGGMGAILKGRDTDLGRDLAIKVLLDAHKDKPDVVQRFIEEAQIGGQLQHPGIAPVYELGQFADRRPFFSMKLVKGETFSKLLEARKDSSEDRGRFLGIFEQICQTMAYAHSRGVIHRDLKPANIMVGAFGEVQVMDWGLAKVLQTGGVADEKKAHAHQSGLSVIKTLRSGGGAGSDVPVVGSLGSQTMMGSVMGTPAYMPPEQALGEIDNLDERADVFGLGAILCEVLTGKPPYIGTDGNQVYRMASRGKLGDCFARLDACGAEAELIEIAKQSLAVEPHDRPRNAGVLAERITSYLTSVESRLHAAEVNRAAEAARAEEALQTAKEHELAASAERRARKLQMGLAAVFVVVLAVGGIAAAWTAAVQSQLKNDALLAEGQAIKARQKESQQREMAEKQRQLAEQQQSRAEREESRAKTAMQQAEAEATRSLDMLADMQAERGLLASRDGQPAIAALWFANAAGLTPHDRARQTANLRRAEAWGRQAMTPVALIKIGKSDARRVAFQPSGSLLMTVSPSEVRVWDWRNEVALPWSESLPSAFDAAWSPDGKTLAVLLMTGEVRLIEPESGTVRGRFSTVSGSTLIDWSPDGSRVAVAGSRLQVWTAKDEPVRESDWAMTSKVYGMRFNRAGTRIVTGHEDTTAQVFAMNDTNANAPLFPAVEHAPTKPYREAVPVFFDDDHKLVTISNALHQPVLRDAATGTLLFTDWKLSGYFDRSLDASRSIEWIAVGGGKDSALLKTDGTTSIVQPHANHVQNAIFAPYNQSLVTLGFEGIVRVFPLRGFDASSASATSLPTITPTVGKPLIIPQQSTFANGVFSSDGSALAVSSSGQVVIWERKSAVPIVGQISWNDSLWRPRPSFDGRFVTSGIWHEYYNPNSFTAKKADLKVARMSDGNAAGPAISLRGLLRDSCICSDNASVAVVTVDGTIGLLSLFDIATGMAKWNSIKLPAPALSISPRPGHSQVAVLCENGNLLVVDTTRGVIEQTHAHPGVSGPAAYARIVYSPDGATIVAVQQNNQVIIRDAQTGVPRCSPFNPVIEGGPCRNIAFSPDSRLLATAVTGKNMVQVWSLADGTKVGASMSHPGDYYGLWSITFSPDGKRLLTGHKDGRVRTFDWQTGEVISMPLQHPDEVNDVRFTSDGRFILVCVKYATIHVWDAATGKLAVPPLPELRREAKSTQTLAIAGDRAVVSADGLYSVVDLTELLPEPEEDSPTLLRLIELATNQKLQVGELVPLEVAEWGTRWEQLVAARQTPEMAAEALVLAFDEAQNNAARGLVAARAARRGLLERVQALRPKAVPLQFALAFDRAKRGDRTNALHLLEQVLDELSDTKGTFSESDLVEAAQVLTPDVPPGRWSALEPTAMSATSDVTLAKQPNGFILATAGTAAPKPSTYVIQYRTKVGRIAALLFEAVPHQSLPNRSSGLTNNFHLTEIRARVLRSDGTVTPLTFRRAVSDFIRPLEVGMSLHDGPWGVIDGSQQSRWDIATRESQPHWLMLTVDPLIHIAEDETLIVELDSGDARFPSARLGHFRLSASAELRNGLAEELQTAIRQRHLPPHELLAAACLINVKPTTAINVLRDAPPIDDNNALVRALLFATAQQQLGKTDEARQIVKEAIARPVMQRLPHVLTGFTNSVFSEFAKLSASDVAKLFAASDNEREVVRLTKAIDAAPTAPAGFAMRASYLARLGRWKECAADYTALTKLEPNERTHWLNAMGPLLLAGDEAGYRAHCQNILDQFGESESPLIVGTLCKTWLIRPDAIDRSKLPLAKLQEFAAAEAATPKPLFLVLNAGLAAYREERFEESLNWLSKAPNMVGYIAAQQLLTRAMAEEKLGRHTAAVTSLARAEALIPSQLSQLGTSSFVGSVPVAEAVVYRDDLINEVLRREAALLIHKSTDRTTPSLTPTQQRDDLITYGRYADAAKIAADEFAQKPTDRIGLMQLAVLQVLANDVAGYRKTCETGIANYTGTLAPYDAERVVKSCLLLPNVVDVTRLPVKLMREGIDDPKNAGYRTWFVASSGLAAYRSGDATLALKETQRTTTVTGTMGALVLIVRSMAEAKLGQREQAQKTLQQAEALIPKELATLGSEKYTGPLPVSATLVIHDWLIAEVLRREAVIAVRSSTTPVPLDPKAEFAKATAREQCAMQGKWSEAATNAKLDLQSRPTERGLFAYTAVTLLMAGDNERHRQFCDQALKPFLPVTDPSVADLLCKACLLAPDSVDPARLPINVLRDGISNSNDPIVSPFYLATNTLILYRAGKSADAIDETRKIPRLTNTFGGVLALTIRAMAEEKLGQHEAAVNTLFEAERLIPAALSTLGTDQHQGESLVSLSTVNVDRLISEVLRREAALLIRKDKARDPDDPVVLNKQAADAYSKGKLDEALGFYRRMLRHDTNNAATHDWVGYILRLQNKCNDAIPFLKRAIELDPSLASAYANLSDVYLLQNKPNEALPHAQKDVELRPQHGYSHWLLGKVLIRLGRFDTAVTTLTKATELVPKDAAFAKSLTFAKELQSVAPILTEFLENKRAPKDNTERIAVASACLYLQKFDGSARFFMAALEADPKLAESFNGVRYNTVCAHARAGHGDGEASKLRETDRATLRKQAVTLLQAEFAHAQKLLAERKPEDRRPIFATLNNWLGDPDLDSLYNEVELAKLPEGEQATLKNLWAQLKETVESSP